jgi:protein TonB
MRSWHDLVRGIRRASLLACGLAVLGVSATGASSGQTSLNIYFQSTLKDQAYQQKTFNRVAAAWKPPAGAGFPNVGTKTVVQAVIAKDGRLVSTVVSTECGSKTWDAAVEKAVRAAAPYDPLPKDYKYPSLEAHFHMSYLAAAR